MAQTLKYIKLANSNGSLSKKFRVLFQDFRPALVAQRSLTRGVFGNLLAQQGSRSRAWTLLLKVYETDPLAGDGYGSKADLETLYNLANPAATPSDTLTLEELVDSDSNGIGDSHFVLFTMPELVFEPMTPMLTGSNSWFMTTVQMGKK